MGSYNEDTGLRDENLHLNDCQHAVTLATKPASYYKISISNLGARLRCGVFRCCAVVAAGLLGLACLGADAESGALIDFVAHGSGKIEATCELDADKIKVERFSGEVPLTHQFSAAMVRCDVLASGTVSVVLSDGRGRQSSVSLPSGRFVVSLQ